MQTVTTPTVTLSAEPDTLLYGESSTLTWSSSNADTCTIEPGIGNVDANGSITVSPTETTGYTITATSPGGTATAGVTVSVTSRISISITSPDNNATISRPYIMVEGAITNPAGIETGVAVNGILAMVSGDRFIANNVPVEQGENTITATATDTDGNTATKSIIIDAATAGGYIRISADTESGVSPLEATLEVDGSFSFTESFISYEGPGEVEFLDSTAENEYNVRIPTPGIYFFTAEVVYQSTTYADRVALVAHDPAALDALLRAKWEGMKTALADGNIETAVSYIAESSREMYEFNFNLMSAYLSEISAGLHNIELLKVCDGMAEYNLLGEQDGQTHPFYLLFVKGSDGIWRIKFF